MSYSTPSPSRQFSAIPQELRHIKIFSTPAGTPSISGKDTRPSNWARWFPSYIQHWGIFLESPTDGLTGGTFFELAFPGGTLGIIQRTKSEREAEEKKNGRWLKWEDTELLTGWTNSNIEAEAERLCRDELQRNYDVKDRNCQTFVNLLIQKIVYGPEPYTPRHTASHTLLGNGPSDTTLIVTRPEDRAMPVPFKGTKSFAPPAWDRIAAKHDYLWTERAEAPAPVTTHNVGLTDIHGLDGIGTVDRNREVALAFARGKSGGTRPEWALRSQISAETPMGTVSALGGQELNRISFSQAEITRIFNERMAVYELLKNSGKLSDGQLRWKWEEMQLLNEVTLKANADYSMDDYKKRVEDYRRGW